MKLKTHVAITLSLQVPLEVGESEAMRLDKCAFRDAVSGLAISPGWGMNEEAQAVERHADFDRIRKIAEKAFTKAGMPKGHSFNVTPGPLNCVTATTSYNKTVEKEV